jgi:hypothetical protein
MTAPPALSAHSHFARPSVLEKPRVIGHARRFRPISSEREAKNPRLAPRLGGAANEDSAVLPHFAPAGNRVE